MVKDKTTQETQTKLASTILEQETVIRKLKEEGESKREVGER